MTKTFWAGIITILASLLSRIWGIEVDDATQQTLVAACQGIADGIGALLAVWGAYRSKKLAEDTVRKELTK